MPGSLSSSSALAEFISTSSPAFSDLPVVLGAVAAGGVGDLDGEVVCAATGNTRSIVNPTAAKYRPSLIAVPPSGFRNYAGGRHSTFSSSGMTGRGRRLQVKRLSTGEVRPGRSPSTICSGP